MSQSLDEKAGEESISIQAGEDATFRLYRLTGNVLYLSRRISDGDAAEFSYTFLLEFVQHRSDTGRTEEDTDQTFLR